MVRKSVLNNYEKKLVQKHEQKGGDSTKLSITKNFALVPLCDDSHNGQFHVKWDNGSGLALIIGEDRFQVQLPEPQTLKFYMPITAQLYGRDDWGDLEEYGNDLNGRDLRDYQSCIHEALLENQVPEEKSRGLMRWYDKQDGVNEKVQSIVFDAESRDGQLWCVGRLGRGI